MTSKKLFFKLIVQDFKSRIWCPIVIFLAYFVSMEMQLINTLDEIQRKPNSFSYSIKHYLANIFFTPDQNTVNGVLAIFAAVLCALSGYAYMHSRKQLDTFHSMPVKRELLFGARYVSGFLMFVIPFALHIVFCLVIATTNGAFSMHGIINAAGFLCILVLTFLVTYSLCVAVVCLTGNMIVSVLGCCVLLGYSLILSLLKVEMSSHFFHTYPGAYEEDIWAFSPLGMLDKILQMAQDYREMNSGYSYRCVIGYSLVVLVATIVFTIMGLLLYKKRATEAAGKPIAFRIAEPFIKSIVVIPFSIYCGLLIQGMFDGDSFSWFVFGVAFGFIICAIVMEIIFRLDFRCAFHHWKQLIFNGACLVLIVVIFKYDVLGYNTYIPNTQELSGCAISFSGLLDIDQQIRTENGGYNYVDCRDFRFDNMNIVDNQSAFALITKAAKEGLKHEEYEYYDGIEDTPEYQAREQKEELYRYISVKLTKKNGKNVYRSYIIDLADAETVKLVADVFNDSDYKLGSFPVLSNGWKKEYSNVECTASDFYDTVKLSPERQAALLQAYQSDLMKLTLDEVMNTLPIGNISFTLKGITKYGGRDDGYKIYPSFTTTIELLKEYGFDYTKKLTAEQVKKIEVERYCESLDEATEQMVMTNGPVAEVVSGAQAVYEDYITVEYNDKEKIEAILPTLVNDELMQGVYAYYIREYESEDVLVYYNNEGIEESRSYQFIKGLKPQFIDEDLAQKTEEVKEELDDFTK